METNFMRSALPLCFAKNYTNCYAQAIAACGENL